MWWWIPGISELGIWKQKEDDQRSKVILGYTLRSRSVWVTRDPVGKRQERKTSQDRGHGSTEECLSNTLGSFPAQRKTGWWCTPTISASGRFKVIMGYTVSSRPAWDAPEKRDRKERRKGGRKSRVPVPVRNSLNHKCTLSRSPDQL